MSLTAVQIAAAASGTVAAGDPNATVTSWAFDSRALGAGACFVALRNHRDGHDFVADAFRRGARVALVDRELPDVQVPPGAAIVHTDDALAALQAVAASERAARSDMVVVGIAGSTGKTSTKDLLAAALSSVPAFANPESYNNEFGLPITLLNTPSSAPAVITEMGERFAGDVAALCAIAQPRIGVVTNVGLAHAEHLGGPDGVAAVLAELPAAIPADGLVVLNADDERTPDLARAAAARVLTVGYSERADYRVSDATVDRSLRPSFALGTSRIVVPLHGAHQIVNAAMAAVVAHEAFGLPWDEVARDMLLAESARWRMEILEAPRNIVVLNDAYNANPTSMEAALRALAHLHIAGRRIAILGDMRELGAHADDAHALVGRLAGELAIDVVVGVGAGGAQIASAADGTDAHVVDDAAAAQHLVAGLVEPGDAVLVKASRALGLQIVADALLASGVAP
jgi:UDP-N-acetylmuramoyl-tripeptide--D-alanyl-D-alanine ligase